VCWCNKRCTYDIKMVRIDNLNNKYIGTLKVNFLIDLLYIAFSWKWNLCCGVGYRAAVESLLVNWWPHFRLRYNMECLCKTRLFIHFPQNERYIKVVQTTDSFQCRSKGEHSVFGKNFRLHSTTFRRVCTEVFLTRGRFVTLLVNKCEVLKAFVW
jgi:hypothetical protein